MVRDRKESLGVGSEKGGTTSTAQTSAKVLFQSIVVCIDYIPRSKSRSITVLRLA